jgi:GH15 family glucan-1,4-alpha-glucosidase
MTTEQEQSAGRGRASGNGAHEHDDGQRPGAHDDEPRSGRRALGEHQTHPRVVDVITSPYPPIGDYGFLSDGEVNALIARSGDVEWMCLPRFDSPSVFGSILDRDAGRFRLGPADLMVPAARRYLPGTMVLETSWGSNAGGWIIVRDVLLMGPWRHDRRHSTHRRAPTDYDAEHVLLRFVRCVNGEMQLVLDCEPAFDYGRLKGEWTYDGEGYNRGTCRASDGVAITLSSDMRIGFEGPRAIARTLIKAGETRFAALSWQGGQPPESATDAYDRLVWTAHHWQHWLARGHFPDHPWRSYLQRSALTLKGLAYAPTGAIAAAATTSLPESPGGERNWDYRYSWIRDATFALWGLYTLGFDWEASDFYFFLADVAGRDAELQIMYGIGGEHELTEETLDHLDGYDHSRPVRIGNDAYRQQQHDVWGAILDSFYIHTSSRDRVDDEMWAILRQLVEQALAHWRDPDRGIWEIRGEPRHFTSSKVMCWVAADRGARLAELRDDQATYERWRAAADEIRDDVLAHGLDERGVFTQHYDTTELDASLLLLPLLGFLPPDDERIRKTVLAIAEELTQDGLVLRYRTDRLDDGLSGVEGSFTICSFWLVSALCQIGEVDRGRRLCERLLSLASPLELYGEEIDPQTGRHLGNFPQAFTHLALINAVMHVIDAEKRRPARGLRMIPPEEGHGNPA